MTNSPFTARQTSPLRRRVMIGLAVGAILVSAAVVYLVTHASAPSAPEVHDHAATAFADTAQRVMLSAEDAARIGVTFAVATMAPMQREVRTVAQVSYDETRVASVALKIDGWVEQLDVNITGQAVRKGDPLLTLYSPMLVSAQQELLVAHRLAADVGAGTSSAREGAANLLQAARQRLAYWDVPPEVIAAVEQSGQVKRTVPFLSPVSGIVVEKPVLAGQRVMAGEVLFKIADLSRVWLEGEVFEPDLAAARPGLEVTAEFPALPGEQRTGRITYVYPTLDPETRTGRIRVELSNPDLALKPGMYATIRFRAPVREALSVPRSAVLATGERTFVFVTDSDGMFTPRYVSVGAATDERIEILSGLAPGERVVASGTFLLDAESNLGAIMGGMGNMPGMDVKAPNTTGAVRDTAKAKLPGMVMPAESAGGADAHANH